MNLVPYLRIWGSNKRTWSVLSKGHRLWHCVTVWVGLQTDTNKHLTYLQCVFQLARYLPLTVGQLVLAQVILQIWGNIFYHFSVPYCKAEHIVGQIPPGCDVSWHNSNSKVQAVVEGMSVIDGRVSNNLLAKVLTHFIHVRSIVCCQAKDLDEYSYVIWSQFVFG